MPVHDWTLVEAGIFHHFHNAWLDAISNALNAGLLPADYYALTEQHAGRTIADVLTLHAPIDESVGGLAGGVALAEAPPRVRHKLTFSRSLHKGRSKTLVLRHVTGHRIVAMLEIVSPANKDRRRDVAQLARKIADALRAGVHVLLVDLFAPGRFDAVEGMHGAVVDRLDVVTAPYEIPPGEPLTLVSYVGSVQATAYLEHLAVGGDLPAMPLFFATQRYVNVPLEATYQAAYRGVPAFWRDVLEGRRTA